VNEGTLLLAKGANVNAMTGTLVVGNFGASATVGVIANFNNFNTAEPMIVNSGGTLNLSGSTAAPSASNLHLRGGTITMGTNTLNVGGTITALPTSTTGSAVVSNTISGLLNLTANTTINTADNGTTPGLNISAPISGGNFTLTKGGAGTLTLNAPSANTYTGT